MEFEIENDVLKKYHGNDGAVTIPDSIIKEEAITWKRILRQVWREYTCYAPCS